MNKNTIIRNGFDEKDYGAFLGDEGDTEFKQAIGRGQKEVPTFPDLFQDTFHALHKFRPERRNIDELDPTHKVNHALIQRAMDSSLYERLRASTRGRADAAALATIALGNHVLQNIPQDLKDEIQKAAEKQKKLEEAGKQLSAEDAQAMDKALKDALDRNASNLNNLVKSAMKSANEAAEEQEALMQAWGTNAGQMQQMPMQERLALARRLGKNEKLKEISKILGRFRRIALKRTKERTEDVAGEIMGIKLGNDLGHLTPVSLARLATPGLQGVVMADFADRKLQQYEVHLKKPKGRGPIVVCMDESSSMTGPCEIWTKAVALALASVAAKEKRHWHAIHFASKSELDQTALKPDATQEEFLEANIRVAEHFFAGGTDFQTPLQAAITAIETQPDLKGADVVFITDGMCGLDPGFIKEFHAKRERLGFNVVTIQVGGGDPGVLKEISQNSLPIHLGSIVNEKDADEVFRLVA